MPGHVKRVADKSGQNGVYDQINGLQGKYNLDYPLDGGSRCRENAVIEEEDGDADCGRHGRIEPGGPDDALETG